MKTTIIKLILTWLQWLINAKRRNFNARTIKETDKRWRVNEEKAAQISII